MVTLSLRTMAAHNDNCAQLAFTRESEYWFALIKVVMVVLFIIVGLIYDWGGVVGHPGPGLANFHDDQAFLGGFAAFSQTFVWAFYSYGGVELVSLAAGETARPHKTIPRAIKATFFRIVLFYVLTMLTIGLCINHADKTLLNAANDSDVTASPLTVVFQRAGFGAAVHVVNAVLLTAVLSATNSCFYASSRMLLALARQGHAPKVFGWVNRRGVPVPALLLSLCVSFLTFLTTIWGSGVVFTWLLNLVGISALLVWGSIGFISIRFRRAWDAQGRSLSDLPYVQPLYPVLPLGTIILAGLMFAAQGYAAVRGEDFDPRNVVATYIGVALYVVLYIGYTVWERFLQSPRPPHHFVPLMQVDLDTDAVWRKGEGELVREKEREEKERKIQEEGGRYGLRSWLQPARILFITGGTTPTPLLPPCENWTKYTHVSGDVYFYHNTLRLITESDVETDEDARMTLLRVWRENWELVKEDGFEDVVPEDAEMVKFIAFTDEVTLLLSHLLFTLNGICSGVKVETGTSSFLDAMAYGTNDALLGDRRNKFPFTNAQMARIVDIYGDLAGTCSTKPAVLPILIWHIVKSLRRVEAARKWYRVPHPSIDGLCGFQLQYARQLAPKTWPLRLVEILLRFFLLRLCTPYWRRLVHVREGVSIDLLGFRSMLPEFLAEWSDSNLLATVLVGASVTFLSLSNITSFQKTVFLISTMFSTLSIAIGLYQTWYHRAKLHADIIEACKYMNRTRDFDNRRDDPADLLMMASLLCLPITSLLWAILCFVVAIGTYGLQCTGQVGKFLAPLVVCVTTLAVCGTMVFSHWLGRVCQDREIWAMEQTAAGIIADVDGRGHVAEDVVWPRVSRRTL
ncbi:hypothetical protein EIP91_010300 [Steccherinum ochraceum]|uniref:Amino acid permease/ SLC12A domain-containing protein n=1 Tax=Steccherinum ochraceum TaxID=92696 RepID=A0A4R0RQY9_9APHY|nr:hypothetical protein EIP91_010300 [Steccherinum ochraceum]